MNWYHVASSTTDPTKSPQFQQWFGNSKAVDDDGRPLTLYHGTTHVFDQFDKKKANPENHFGRAFYFSTHPHDVSHNYAGEGPDLTSNIRQLADQIMTQRGWDGEVAYQKSIEMARKKLSGGTPNMIPAYLKMRNPLIIDPTGDGTQFHIEYETDEDGEYTGREMGNGSKLLQAIESAAQKYNIPNLVNEFGESSQELLDGMSAYDVDKVLRQCRSLGEITDRRGRLIGTHVIAEIFRRAGFDGIIMDAYHEFGKDNKTRGPLNELEWGTKHYIVFRPEQIKSSLGNQTFDPKDKRFGY